MRGKCIISVAYPQYFLSKDFIKSPPPPPQRTLRFTPIRLHGTPSFASGGEKKERCTFTRLITVAEKVGLGHVLPHSGKTNFAPVVVSLRVKS